MAFLWIQEFEHVAFEGQGYDVPCAKQPNVTEQVEAITTGSTQSNAFNARTKFVELKTDVDCHIKFGANPTASKTTGGTTLLEAGERVYYGVNPGDFVAVIDDT